LINGALISSGFSIAISTESKPQPANFLNQSMLLPVKGDSNKKVLIPITFIGSPD